MKRKYNITSDKPIKIPVRHVRTVSPIQFDVLWAMLEENKLDMNFNPKPEFVDEFYTRLEAKTNTKPDSAS